MVPDERADGLRRIAPPGSHWVRADGLRVGDEVYVCHRDEEQWGEIIDVQPYESTMLLLIQLETGGGVIELEHPLVADTLYLRRPPPDRVPRTTVLGLDRAREIYSGNWDANGTVSVYLLMSVVKQLLYARGWVHRNRPDGTHESWVGPDNERFWETSEALQFALTAEVLDGRP